MNSRLRIPLIILAVGTLAGCSRLAGGASAVAPVEAEPTSQTESPACFNTFVEQDLLPQTIAMESSISLVIGVGTYSGKGESFWVSASGLPPTTDREAGRATLVTSISLNADALLRGDPTAPFKPALQGGVLGCSTMTYSSPLALDDGTRYLFFGTKPDPGETPQDFVLIFAAWPVSVDDVVQTPTEGEMKLADVALEIAKHPAVPPGGPLPFPSSDSSGAEPSIDTAP